MNNRDHPEARSLGTALVNTHPWSTHEYRIISLSASGMLLRGEHRLPVGQAAQVLLRLPGQQALSLDVRVIRSAEHTLVLELTDLEQGMEDRLHDALLSVLSGSCLRPLPSDFVLRWEPLPGDDLPPPRAAMS